MCAVHVGLPYDCMTSMVIIEIGKYVVMMINTFLPKSGISRTYSLCTITMGKKLYLKKQFRCLFGA